MPQHGVKRKHVIHRRHGIAATGFDVNGLLIQGGGTICASLDAGLVHEISADIVQAYLSSHRSEEAADIAAELRDHGCGCRMSWPQLEPGRINHGPGCPQREG
jgi:hypothetical protein